MDKQAAGVPLPDLSPRSREKLLGLASVLTFPEGQLIFHEGDHALNLYIVKSGRVAIECHVPPRGTAPIRTIGVTLLERSRDRELVVIVDAVSTGAAPGTVLEVPLPDDAVVPRSFARVSGTVSVSESCSLSRVR